MLARFFSGADLFWVPICFFTLFFILRSRANRNSDPRIRQLYYRAFYFKVICVFLFTFITEYYFRGGDTGLYYQATKDLRAAMADNPDHFWLILKTYKLEPHSPLVPFFYYDNYADDVTYAYMVSPHNFFPPKIALVPSLLFGNSYLCINLCFAFFALGGAIRLFKAFYYFYPDYYRELALACLFLPGVAFWSAGLLKDPITFGCIGIIIYALVNIIFRKRQYFFSVLWILIAGFFIYSIKVYILLVLVLSLMLWLFVETNRLIKDKTLRNVFTALCLVAGIGVGFALLNFVTTLEQAEQFQLDKLLDNVEREREGYERLAQYQNVGSNFSINASNPALLALGGIAATFYRPFLWEVNSPIVLFSAVESMIFLLITLNFMFKRGPGKFFTESFSDGKIVMCLVFAFVFAIAVGSATGNFGTLSRYKIPCMPFYLLLVVLLYRKTKLALPKWFNRIVNIAVPQH
ncbi:MAG TPA: hypothetical protein VF476_06870 [Chitinophagaceae bacterium]